MKKEEEDTYSYRGWLVSDSLIKRAFAVWGHYMVAGLIVVAPMILLSMITGFLSVFFK